MALTMKGILSSGMLHSVVQYMFADVWEEHAVSIFGIEE